MVVNSPCWFPWKFSGDRKMDLRQNPIILVFRSCIAWWIHDSSHNIANLWRCETLLRHKTYCWWFRSPAFTRLRLVGYPHKFLGFQHHPRWLARFQPSTVWWWFHPNCQFVGIPTLQSRRFCVIESLPWKTLKNTVRKINPGGGSFQRFFFEFSSRKIGEDGSNLTIIFFQMGWNHSDKKDLVPWRRL